MKTGNEFHRFNSLMAAIAAILANAEGAFEVAQAQAKMQEMAGGYESRGHGGKRAHRNSGVAAIRRARVKAKGRAQNRRNHKGRAGQ